MDPVCPHCHEQHDADAGACAATAVHAAVPRAVDGPQAVRQTVADPLIGQLLADRYRVQRLLGEGGMGRVYLAKHERMGRMSAVKVMSPSLASTPEAISRFNREAENASRIHQPNVAAIYDFGETMDGVLYLAMEFVEGETLSAVIRRDGPLAVPRAAALAGQVADGLQAAHHLGIVHRDLKPDNILVTRHHDGREWVKIVDFGIAKQTRQNDQTVTSLGVAIGTPEYMSPEQIAGEALDARTDLYSLGLVLFTMLTGQLPHPAMTSKQSMVQRLTARPRTLAEVVPGKAWSPRLQKALDRALAPEPDDRYSSVADFARDVQSAAMQTGSGANVPSATPVGAPALREPRARATTGSSVVQQRSGGGGWIAVVLVLLVAGGGVAAMGRTGLASLLGDADVARVATAPRLIVAPIDSSRAVAASPAHAESATVVLSALSPMAPGQQLERAALASRRAPGDSLAAGSRDAVMQTAEDDAREIMVHVNRARELARSGGLQGAGLEIRTSYEEYRIFLTEHAAAPQVDALRHSLQLAMDEALTACNVARDADVAGGGKGFRCEYPAKTGVLMVYDAAPSSPRATP